MSTPYTPTRGSLAEQVVSYFTLHPNDAMTLDDVIQTFRPSGTKGNIKLGLEKAIDAGLLRWSGGLLTAGPALETAADATTAKSTPAVRAPWPAKATPKPHPLTGTKRGHLPPLDLAALEVDFDVPIPDGRRTRRGESRWVGLLAKLPKAGASIALPREYNSSLSAWLRKVKKTNPSDKRQFRLGFDTAGVNRVWRTA